MFGHHFPGQLLSGLALTKSPHLKKCTLGDLDRRTRRLRLVEADDTHLDPGGAGSGHVQFYRGSIRQVNYTVGVKRSAIVDTDNNAAAIAG